MPLKQKQLKLLGKIKLFGSMFDINYFGIPHRLCSHLVGMPF